MNACAFERNLLDVNQRISAAARASGRGRDEITLIAASKTRSAEEVLALHRLGVDNFGENYVDEALDKIRHCASESITWHFIGRIQSNKTRAIAEHFDWVHTVDRERVARRLSSQRQALTGTKETGIKETGIKETELKETGLKATELNVLLQVNIDDDPNKAGCPPDLVPGLAETVAALPNLKLRGLMTILDPATDPAAGYGNMAQLARTLSDLIPVPCLSMGMSGDLDAAIAAGATHVRVGTALMGERDT